MKTCPVRVFARPGHGHKHHEQRCGLEVVRGGLCEFHAAEKVRLK